MLYWGVKNLRNVGEVSKRWPGCGGYAKVFLDIVECNAHIVDDHFFSPFPNEAMHHRHPYIVKRDVICTLCHHPVLLALVCVCDHPFDVIVFLSECQHRILVFEVTNKDLANATVENVGSER